MILGRLLHGGLEVLGVLQRGLLQLQRAGSLRAGPSCSAAAPSGAGTWGPSVSASAARPHDCNGPWVSRVSREVGSRLTTPTDRHGQSFSKQRRFHGLDDDVYYYKESKK